MAVSIKESVTLEASASGILKGISATGITVEDDKTGVQVLNFAEINKFIGTEVKFKLSNKKTEEV